MPETKLISTTTTKTVDGSDITIYSFYDPKDTGHLLSALIADIPETIDGAAFIEGELAMRFQHTNYAAHLDFIVNGDGELLVISHDSAFPANIYSIEQLTGELQIYGPYSSQSLVFDGILKYCTYTPIVLAGDFTLSMWIKPTLSNNNPLWGEVGNSHWTRLTTLSSVTLKWNVATTLVALGQSFVLGEWEMFTITRIGSAVKIYKGDTEVGSVTKSDTFTPNTFGIKNRDGATPNYHSGNMDAVTIWNSGFVPAEVTELKGPDNRPIDPNTHSKVANLTNHWRMGEDDDISSITDLVGSNHATPVNMLATDIVYDTAA